MHFRTLSYEIILTGLMGEQTSVTNFLNELQNEASTGQEPASLLVTAAES